MAIAEIVEDAGLPEPLEHEVTLARQIPAAVEEDVGQCGQAAVQPLAAAAQRTHDVGSRLERRDRRGHLAVGNVLDVLVEIVGDEGRQIGEDQGERDQHHDRPADQLPGHAAPRPVLSRTQSSSGCRAVKRTGSHLPPDCSDLGGGTSIVGARMRGRRRPAHRRQARCRAAVMSTTGAGRGGCSSSAASRASMDAITLRENGPRWA